MMTFFNMLAHIFQSLTPYITVFYNAYGLITSKLFRIEGKFGWMRRLHPRFNQICWIIVLKLNKERMNMMNSINNINFYKYPLQNFSFALTWRTLTILTRLPVDPITFGCQESTILLDPIEKITSTFL